MSNALPAPVVAGAADRAPQVAPSASKRPQVSPEARLATLEVFAAAAALTLFNALKPIHLDDIVWWYFARHIAEHPTAPFDFTTLWYQTPRPAMNVMAPPFLPYWWGAAIALFGDRPFLWKLALFPINLLLSFSVRALARRFAPGLDRPLLWLILLSPVILPSENLMLDVPCVALLLSGIALYLHACETQTWRLGVAAGALIGLATLTKWNGLTGIAELVLITVMLAPSLRWLLIAGVPVAMFVGWELILVATVGESHFLHHLGVESNLRVGRSPDLLRPLITIMAAVAPALPVLAAARLRRAATAALVCIAAYAAGFVLIAFPPGSQPSLTLTNPLSGAEVSFRIDSAVLMALAALLFGALGLLAAVELRTGLERRVAGLRRRLYGLLLGWVAIELAGYFVFSPFPAVRRVIGLVVAITFAVAFVVAHTPAARRNAWLAAAASAALGLLYQLVDTQAALAARHAAADAHAFIRKQDPAHTIWFTGEHGFEYYATQQGMMPASPNLSRLEPGDWLVVSALPDRPVEKQITYALDASKLRLEERLDQPAAIPLTTYVCFYGSRRPMEHQSGPRNSAWIYRVLAPYMPVTPPAPAAAGTAIDAVAADSRLGAP